jgi:hypothetical protein
MLSSGMSPNMLASGNAAPANVQMVSIPVNTTTAGSDGSAAGVIGASAQPYAQVMVREETTEGSSV